MQLLYNVKDKPKFGLLIVQALQQLLAIMTATLVVPLIIGNDMSPAAALFGAGVGTLIYVAFTKMRSPVFLGSSFAFIGSMTAAFAGGISMSLGYLGLIIGAAFAGLVYVVIALIVKIAGVNWVNRLMPAVVIGPIVAIIGLSLATNAIGDLQKVNYTEAVDTNDISIVSVESEQKDENGNIIGGAISYSAVDDEGNVIENIAVSADENGVMNATTQPGSVYVAILCGLVTLFATMLSSSYGKKTAKLIPFVIGIIAGYAFASILSLLGDALDYDALKIIDYSAIKALFADGVKISTFFNVPDFTFLTAIDGTGELTASYIGTIAVAYIPVAFVVFAEHIADHKNISSIIESDLLEDPGLHRTLLGDGVGSMFGAFFGGCPNTTYGESIGCVAITRSASVYTILTAAIGAMVIAFLSPFIAFVNTIPSCVMGGVCMALYGFIAVSGLKMLQAVDLNQNKNLFVASTSLIAGIGGLTIQFGEVTVTSIACALILGIIVNLLLKNAKEN